MSIPAATEEAARETYIRNYQIICFGSLWVLLLGLLLRGQWQWSHLPIAVGVLALLRGWRSGPLLVSFTLAWLFYSNLIGLNPLGLLQSILLEPVAWLVGVQWNIPMGSRSAALSGSPTLADGLIGIGLAGYCAGNYRLQAWLSHLFPRVIRRHQTASAAIASTRNQVPLGLQRCSALQSKPAELLLLFLTLLGCVSFAYLLWSWLVEQETELDMQGETWRGILLLWMMVVAMCCGIGCFRYLAQTQWSRSEALLYLQDSLWQEMRRELRYIESWRVRARIKAERDNP